MINSQKHFFNFLGSIIMITISVVTICYNNLEQLIETCQSVDVQTVSPDEHIIVNGSTDRGIADWLDNQPHKPYRKIFHIENRGIAGNWNYGIEKANSDYINILNASDKYIATDLIENIKSFLTENNYPDWISGKYISFRGGGWKTVGMAFDKNQLYKGMRSIGQPTWFVKKFVYEKIGLYKDYPIATDYDMMCRIKNCSYNFIDIAIAKFDNTGLSSTKYNAALKETIKVYESNFGYSLKCRLWQVRQWFTALLLSNKFIQKLYHRLQ